MKVLILSSSPRREGNSAVLAGAVAAGLAEAGHVAETAHLADEIGAFLRDCRQCRRPDGSCAIDDGYRSLFLDRFLAADGLVLATPIYWYGMSAQLKAFFDRMFCYVAASYPESESVKARMTGKRIGLVLSSEEAYPTVSAAIVQQIREYSRYTRSRFAGVVHGYGNARGEVRRDPLDPLAEARRLGRGFFDRYATDYEIDTDRPARVWPEAAA
ncbi:flavodoxin family protein [Inquilinus sp. Marseille-Q2685]|uniref:flavodoxin family protein n=1 Tax=Inquilinus sp. Marseille-Q2685 TaxID=2866581 RepID=UPI001CE499AB|nr:flavodoxin family protein [Inquilinus sp. Marseille-Q2685]